MAASPRIRKYRGLDATIRRCRATGVTTKGAESTVRHGKGGASAFRLLAERLRKQCERKAGRQTLGRTGGPQTTGVTTKDCRGKVGHREGGHLPTALSQLPKIMVVWVWATSPTQSATR